MQACEVCGWDTRSGARVCSACRLERDDAVAARATAASADPTGSSLLQDLLAATGERSGGGGTTTAVRQLRTAEDGADAGVTTAEVRVNGTATGATSDHGSHGADGNGDRSGTATVEAVPTAGDTPPDAAADATSETAAVAPADESGGVGTADQTDRVATADQTETATADQTEVGTTTPGPGIAARDAAAEPEHDAAAATSDADPVHGRDASSVRAPSGERPTSSETPQPGRGRLDAALARAGGWTGVAQFALLVLGMLCVFQVVVLVVVNQFLSRAAAGEAAAADALAAHDKVTGVMFPALALVAIAVCVFAGARSDDDSGRGGVHRRVAGLPPALWIMVATATAVLTMGLLDAAKTVAQARDVTLRAIVVCSVLGLAAFVAPRGFAAREPPADDPRRPARSPDGRASSDEPSRQVARAPTDGGREGSAAADDSR